MRCLLVDDEPGIREGLATLLRRQGHDVRTAADCASARAALTSGTFDVVVSDWRLPDGTAAAFAAGCVTPVLAVSGHPEEVTALPSIVAVLQKPIAPAALLAAMRAAIVPPAASIAAAPWALPAPVRAVVDTFVAALPPAAVVDLHDDGTIVAVRTELPLDLAVELPPFGGDLRRTRCRDRQVLELRLWREGTAVPGGPGSSQGTTDDMPMRESVGPCVQAELADLWSQT